MPGRVPKTCRGGTLGTWFDGGFGSSGLMVGLGLTGLFQP